MANLTRIKNNQITDTTIVANAKVVPYSISSTLLANNLTYGSDLTITGNLTVQGNSTAIDSTITTIEDPVILLASTQTGSPTVDIGFIGDRGSSSNVAFVWREANSEFVTAFTSTGETNSTITISSYANFHTNNANVSGNLSIGGNVIGNITFDGTLTAGNLATPGYVSATGNATAGNISTAGAISATGTATVGNVSTAGFVNAGSVSASGNITGDNVFGTAVSASGNVVAGNVYTAGIVSTVGNVFVGAANAGYVYGNAYYMSGIDQTASANKIFNGTSNVDISSANANITMSVNGTSNVIVVNATGANVDGYLLVTGTIDGNTITATGNLSGANISTGGQISATGTVFAGNIDVSSGNVGANNVNAGSVSAAGDITGGNIRTAGLISATGTAQLGNVQTTGIVSATGNVTGNYFIGNGSQLTGIDATRIINGTSNVAIPNSNGNIEMTVNGNANVVLVTSTGANVNGYANISGNVSAGNAAIVGNVSSGNLLTTGFVSATGNVYANTVVTSNIEGATQLTISTVSGDIVINPAGSNIDVSTAWINNLADPINNQDAATKKYVDDVAQGLNVHDSTTAATPGNLATISGGTVSYNNGNAGVGANLVTTGTYTNIDGVAINTVGTRILVKDEANAAWNGIYTYSNSTVLVRALDFNTVPEVEAGDFVFNLQGNIYGNTGWVETAIVTTIGTDPIEFTQFSGAGQYQSGNGISLTGLVINTIYDGNITVNGSNQLSIANGAVLLNPNITNATGTSFSATGNINGGNFNTGGLVTATGNVTGGNINTVGVVAGGNITSGGLVSAVGNIIGNNISATTEVSAASISASGTIQGGNIGTAGIVTATGNITGGNIATGGEISATGSATAGNIYTGGIVSAVGNIVANSSSFFIGNGSQLTGVAASSVNAAALIGNTLSSNVTFSSLQTVGTLANLTVTDYVSAGGNVIGGNINTLGTVSANIVTATGNVTGANINTAGIVSSNTICATGNVTGAWFNGNVDFGAGIVSGTGNVYAANFIGNISGNIDAAGSNTQIQFNTTGDLLGANANFTYDYNTNLFTVNGGNILAGNSNITGTTQAGNVTIAGNDITGTNGIVTINAAGADVNFAVSGDTVANVFFVDAGTGTASFGSDAQTTNAIVAFNATNSILMPVGNTVQRPSTGVTGMLRFNTTLNAVEVYDNGAWTSVGSEIFTVIDDQQFNGDGSTVAFTLNSTQTTSSVIVSINGVLQIPTTAYAVAGTNPTCVLTFTEAPQSGDVIDVRGITTTTTVASIEYGNSSVTATGATVDIEGNLNPTGNLLYSLGNNTNRWSNLYVGGNTIYLGNLQLKEASANTFAVYTADGVTEANIQVGNIDVTSIQSGTSTISIAAPNGNAVMNVAGTDRIVATTTGAVITGTVNANGNITGGNFLTAGLISATSTITGSALYGGGFSLSGNTITSSGSTLTIDPNGSGGVNGAVVIAGNLSVQGNVTYIDSNVITTNEKSITLANNQSSGAALDGAGIDVGNNTLAYWRFNNATTSWQSNIAITPAANATLNLGGTSNYWASIYATGATVSGTVNTGAIYSTNEISAAGTVTGANFSTAGNVQTSGGRFYASNGPSVAILTGSAFTIDGTVSASGNITGGNLSVVGNATITGNSVTIGSSFNTITLQNGTVSVVGNVQGGNIQGATLSTYGNITGANLTVGTGTVTLGNIVNANGNGVGNIGSSSLYFNTVFAKATSAQYADLAENYVADDAHAPGTVVSFGGTREVTKSDVDGDRRVAGVVSTNPSYIMNAGCTGEHVATVALTGRVPCRVTGTVRKGDMMVSNGDGTARSEANPQVGSVIGKALANFDGQGEGMIEVVIGRF